ncbi:MAG: DUF58 domain-containing protein [Phycisphaera sp.]|nr:DUF58 domain-containing protein [Phycisphaera sp.]
MSDTDAAFDRMRAEQYLAPETIGQLGSLELRARMIAEGVMSGMHRSPYQGLAVEFAQHRQYVPGDDLRHLDWKVFGRSDKLHLKQYQQETNLDINLLVDCSASMRYGTLRLKKGWGGTDASRSRDLWTKFDHATAIGAAMCYLSLQQRDRVGLSVFADGIESQVKRSNARDTWRRMVRTLSSEVVDAKTDVRKVVDQALAAVGNRSLFVMISDFLVPIEDIEAAIARIRHRRHDLMLLQVLDRQELRFDLDDPSPFEGLEGEGRMNVDPRVVREDYLAAIEAHCGTIEKSARSHGYDYLRLDTHASVGPAIAAMLGRRKAFARGGGRS